MMRRLMTAFWSATLTVHWRALPVLNGPRLTSRSAVQPVMMICWLEPSDVSFHQTCRSPVRLMPASGSSTRKGEMPTDPSSAFIVMDVV